MPTYEYKCKSCGEMSEVFQSMSAAHLKKCPLCGKNALERQIGTGAAIVFKGSGFYQTDYRSESYKKSAEAESKPAAAASGNGESKGASGDSAFKKAESAPAAAESKPKPAADPKPAAESKSAKKPRKS